MSNVELLFKRFQQRIGSDVATRYPTHTGCLWVSREYSFEVFSEANGYNEHAVITRGNMIVDDATN